MIQSQDVIVTNKPLSFLFLGVNEAALVPVEPSLISLFFDHDVSLFFCLLEGFNGSREKLSEEVPLTNPLTCADLYRRDGSSLGALRPASCVLRREALPEHTQERRKCQQVPKVLLRSSMKTFTGLVWT